MLSFNRVFNPRSVKSFDSIFILPWSYSFSSNLKVNNRITQSYSRSITTKTFSADLPLSTTSQNHSLSVIHATHDWRTGENALDYLKRSLKRLEENVAPFRSSVILLVEKSFKGPPLTPGHIAAILTDEEGKFIPTSYASFTGGGSKEVQKKYPTLKIESSRPQHQSSQTPMFGKISSLDDDMNALFKKVKVGVEGNGFYIICIPKNNFQVTNNSKEFTAHFTRIRDMYLQRFYILLYGTALYNKAVISEKVKANNCISYVMDVLGLYIRGVAEELEAAPLKKIDYHDAQYNPSTQMAAAGLIYFALKEISKQNLNGNVDVNGGIQQLVRNSKLFTDGDRQFIPELTQDKLQDAIILTKEMVDSIIK